MKLLLPPSESKSDGGSGRLALGRLSRPALNPARSAVLQALVALSADRAEAARVLHLGPEARRRDRPERPPAARTGAARRRCATPASSTTPSPPDRCRPPRGRGSTSTCSSPPRCSGCSRPRIRSRAYRLSGLDRAARPAAEARTGRSPSAARSRASGTGSSTPGPPPTPRSARRRPAAPCCTSTTPDPGGR